MYPVNQVILGGDPMMSNLDDIDMQIQRMESYRQRLKQMKEAQQAHVNQSSIWNEIDAEIAPMTSEQRNRLLQDQEYIGIYNELQSIVQAELLNVVKGKIENSERGKNLLLKQLEVVKRLKTKIVNNTNREMELFNKFKEYSKTHPEATYEKFLKDNI